jgi:2,3-dihydroxy-p-cumate/2,3-dihydroxybenzoate 3,4-dioxygenase
MLCTMKLRSVELQMPDTAAAATFLEGTWGLAPVDARGGTRWFRGSGEHPFILSISEAPAPAVTAVTFAGPEPEVRDALARVKASGASHKAVGGFDVPGGGSGFVVQGPEAQAYRFIAETGGVAKLDAPDMPVQITHAVMNAVDVAACERFAVDVLGFRVSDRTKMMTFVRCNRKHHCVAYAHAAASSLNHIAFEMQGFEAVMRGAGRMRDAGFDLVWGPGRHGPGNNVFGYFIAPFGGVIEYTAEVSEVGDDYRVGGPEDWKWPPGRIDHWGLSKKDMSRIAPAERVFRFPASLHA